MNIFGLIILLIFHQTICELQDDFHISTILDAQNNLKNVRDVSNECREVDTTSCRSDTKLCEHICEGSYCEIRAVVILPSNVNEKNVDITLELVMPELERALADARNANLIPDWINFRFIRKDDRCMDSYAQLATIEAFNENCPHVIFGPICEYAVAQVSRIIKFFGIPIFSPGGLSSAFENPKYSCDDEYFLFVRTSNFFFKGISLFFRSIMMKYNWRKILFLYDENGQYEVTGAQTCSLYMNTLAAAIMDIENFAHSNGNLGMSTMNITEYLRNQIGVDYGITVICASRNRVREILLAAESLDKMVYNGEYLFFNIEIKQQAKYLDRPWYDENDTEDNNKRLKEAYKSVIILTSRIDDKINATKYRNNSSKFISDFYNSFWLYAKTLNTFLKEEHTNINGYELVKRVYNTKFLDQDNEIFHINCQGSRLNSYSLLSYNPNLEKFEVVANYNDSKNEVEFLKDRKIYWLNGDTVPPDTPKCGFDNSKCPDTSLPTYVIISISLVGVALLLVVIAIFMYRKYKLEAEISSMTWKIHWDEIIDLQNTSVRRGSLSNSSKRGSQLTINSELYSLGGERQIFVPIGYYKKNKVAIKSLALIKFDLNRAQLIRLKQMKDLQNDNLVKFYGACIESPNCCIATEYCPKGSLQDILENDQINLEWMIRISLIQDIVKGMSYLHQSEIKSHGALSSTNCVVDSRFVLKITDFGLTFFKKDETFEKDSYAYWRHKLWTAPELLQNFDTINEGTQKGDVYSFAIIIHEIIFRQGTFYLGDNVELTPTDIILTLKNYMPNTIDVPLRPYVEETDVNPEIITLMQKCWNEDLLERPDFSVIKNIIKKINKENDTGNILDNLLSRMEQYANNLEDLVEERTADYLEEKKKCEDLLYQLLPKAVAFHLINGQAVIAETFEEVTIYFSDIVGFTSLSASSTPLQVVDLLNDLYTCFDSIIGHFDVYKVETIGDAYMVVSGLPVRNGSLHSREIARMSLALLDAVGKFKIRHRPDEQLKLRIGLHTGSCVAGVVGLKMPRYCLFGDTVNTASRMESNGIALKIHISPFTKKALDAFANFEIEERGEIELKGKGKMLTYWLNGEKELSNSENLTSEIKNENIINKWNNIGNIENNVRKMSNTRSRDNYNINYNETNTRRMSNTRSDENFNQKLRRLSYDIQGHRDMTFDIKKIQRKSSTKNRVNFKKSIERKIENSKKDINLYQ